MALAAHALLAAAENVIWVPVPKPVFDLTGVVLYSLGLAGICAATALVLGAALGFALIARARRHPPDSWSERSLQLLDARRP